MTWEITIVLAIVAGVLGLLAFTRIAADAVLLAAVTALMVVPYPAAEGWRCGVLGTNDAISGFSNSGMLTVGFMFIVVAGLRETGAVDWISHTLLGRPKSERGAILRVVLPVWGMSVFLNNTPVVAMMIGAIQDWCKKLRVSPSKLMIPLSYAAILGGTCSLIGTSTNLVVAGLVVSQTDLPPLKMFDITWVGLPVAAVGVCFLVVVGPILLPSRIAAKAPLADPMEYTLELIVPEGSSLAGKTVEQAGMRNLPGCFLAEIERAEEVVPAVGPEQVLRAGDRLLFVGVVESIKELANTRGLALATNQVFKLDSPRYRRRLFETVIAPSGELDGKTIKESRFRNRHNGAVIAVARNGQRVHGRLGDIKLQAGDLLLVEADPGFAERAEGSRDFLLVRRLEDSTPRRHSRAPLAIGILVGMVLMVSLGVLPMMESALVASGIMILTRCCTITEARQSVDLSVLVVIASALALGIALESSGAANLIADGVIGLVGTHPWMVLLGVYAVTAFTTEIITNNAAVAIAFPIAQAAAQSLGVDLMPFVIAIMMGGSASFATPLGYQCNMMVYGPGGYTFADFLKIGIPMNVLVGIITVAITPFVFPFNP